MNLEEVYKQIDKEAEEAALVYPYSAGDDEPMPRPHVNGVRKAYYIKGATPYAEKWHEMEQLKDRYEMALKAIQNHIIKCQNESIHINQMAIALVITQALTPKTSTDDTANG